MAIMRGSMTRDTQREKTLAGFARWCFVHRRAVLAVWLIALIGFFAEPVLAAGQLGQTDRFLGNTVTGGEQPDHGVASGLFPLRRWLRHTPGHARKSCSSYSRTAVALGPPAWSSSR